MLYFYTPVDALIDSGMAALGYTTVNVVCNGWTGRDPTTHVLQENKTNWPNGIAELSKYLHSKDLQMGCYTSPATVNCCGEPGSLGYEDIDMEFFAEVGCDHIMTDWCRGYVDPSQTRAEYAKISEGIAKSSNPNMVNGVWSAGFGKSYKWSTEINGHYWRTTGDIHNEWSSILHNFDVTYTVPSVEQYTTPGHYNFLDQLFVGVPQIPGSFCNGKGNGLTVTEWYSHYTMWVMAASPLMVCTDVRNLTADVKAILFNPEVLEVHKDSLAKMAVRIDVGGGALEEVHSGDLCSSSSSIYGKQLSDGSSAVMVP